MMRQICVKFTHPHINIKRGKIITPDRNNILGPMYCNKRFALRDKFKVKHLRKSPYLV